MASGQRHERAAAITLGVGIAAIALSMGIAPPDAPQSKGIMWGIDALRVGIAGGLVLGWLFGPDLDADGITKDEARWKRVPLLGPLLYIAMVWLWLPYAVLMPHRSPISHGCIVGAVIRMAYLCGIVYAICCLAKVPPPNPTPLTLLGILAGWIIQDAVHILLDHRR